MYRIMAIFFLTALLTACANSQQQTAPAAHLVGGPCEGCEAIFEYGNKLLRAVDTLPGFTDGGTRIKLTGTVYQPDGRTPASNVILYIYHTDTNGVYPTRGNETGWDRRHGYIRGWIKTGKDGQYTFYTRRPGQYPNRAAPAHVHATILEPNGSYYYLHDYYFKDDPLLSKEEAAKTGLRGGDDRVLTLLPEGDLLVGRRDIVLGKNVPGYTADR
jgi:protocatechuate 3,4-dioxygenase, beta subunit